MLPLHPDVWPYFLHRFYVDDHSDAEGLFLNIMGDFGASGMPGTFKVFFCDVDDTHATRSHANCLHEVRERRHDGSYVEPVWRRFEGEHVREFVHHLRRSQVPERQ